TDMQKLSRLLSTIKAVLEDAEQKQFIEKAIQLWFKELNVVACEIDDVLDDYAAEASRVKIGTRMKDILEKFNAIADERKDLGLSDQKRGSYFNASRETGSTVNEPEVLGRDEEKEQIVRILTKEKDRVDQNVSVLPIVGVGGLGKTTLAQLIFSDKCITEHFELKLWVWVSEDFDVKRIIKVLIESVEKTSIGDLALNILQGKLQELLRGKRYLIVLDDVWNENPREWEKMKSVLQCGSRGSSIVVTTRKQKVAEIMRTLETHYLSSLSEDRCWALFKQQAFDCQEKEERLEAVGKEIVKKCGGVPLAAKALGAFLRFKSEAEWNSVKCSELWNLPEDETDILPALRLSYLNLPVELRGCFAYCAVFPKGYEIEKEEVKHLWMANGLITSNGTMEVEDVGDAVLTELHNRSLFQAVEKEVFARRSVPAFKMHDLVHNLAQSVMEAKHGGTESNRTMMLDMPHDQLTTLPKGMRFLRNLRHLCLQGCGSLTHVPSGIGKLTCLRTLSKAVLGGKKGFQLSELRDLNMLGGELSIRHLERIEDKKDAEATCLIKKQSLRELNLHWDSERTLQRYNDEEVLEALKPSPNLQLLCVLGFKGSSSLPSWISTVTTVTVLGSAVEYIVGAQESTAAAAMSLSMKQLTLINMPNLKEMLGREVQGTPRVFSQLQSLRFENCPTLTLPLPRMPSLKKLSISTCPNMAWASISNLTSLNSFEIARIEGLSCFPEEMLQNLSLLESLVIRQVKDLRALPKSLASLTALKKLNIWDCPMLESLPEEGLRGLASLQKLDFVDCYNLVSLSMGTKALKSLTHLRIKGSDATALPEEVKHLPALQKLELDDFPNLTSLPNCIQMMTTLQSLTINYCELLGPRCQRGREEWHKIKHIPFLDLKIE
ncbi:unnamed protein product, partial [Coffea canephora]